jgi:hypothetical protein
MERQKTASKVNPNPKANRLNPHSSSSSICSLEFVFGHLMRKIPSLSLKTASLHRAISSMHFDGSLNSSESSGFVDPSAAQKLKKENPRERRNGQSMRQKRNEGSKRAFVLLRKLRGRRIGLGGENK